MSTPSLPWWTNATTTFVPGHGLGRRPSQQSFPRLLTMTATPFTVNRRLDLPYQYRLKMDQGQEGACVGFAWSWAMSILNRRLYAARKLYLEAQLIDPWDDTPPQEGTSTYAGAQVLMTYGHWRFARGITFAVAASEGITAMRSARTVDELRAAIFDGVPFVLGINWYTNFHAPEWGDFGKGGKRWWIGRTAHLGSIAGGHAICGFGARDDIEAFTLVNSWGMDYPIVNIPYTTVQRLLDEDGDAIIPVDRV